MLENVSAEEANVGRGLFWLWKLLLLFQIWLIDLQGDGILLQLFSKFLAKLNSFHQLLAVSNTLRRPLLGRRGFNFNDFILSKRINLVLLSNIDFMVLLLSFIKHLLVFSVFFLINKERLFTCLSPDSDRIICTNSNKNISNAWGCQRPNFTEEIVEHKNFIIGVTIKEFNRVIFWAWHYVMRLSNELHTCNRILMSKYWFMYVTKIKSPNFNILISGSRHEKIIVRRNVKAQNWKRMAIEIQR